MITYKDIAEILTEEGHEDSLLFKSPSYIDAVIGISENGQVCYSYKKMIDFLVNKESLTYDEAIDFIEYSTIRSLVYFPADTKPIVIYDINDYFDE